MTQINVKGILETLDFIIQNKASVARYGDGEMELMIGWGIPYQSYNEELSSKLSMIITQESNSQCVICVPDIFSGLEKFNDFAFNFYVDYLQRCKHHYLERCQASWYGNAFISRPYIDRKDKSQSIHYFNKLKKLWQDRDILIVEGHTSRSGVGNDLFNNAKSIQRIICPSRHAYSKINEIKQAIIYNVSKFPRLVLLMLGPTATVIAYELSSQYQCIDIGHIDSEYEWFKMGALHKVQLNHKHTAEYNAEHHEQNIVFVESADYEEQIVVRIT